MAGLSAPPHPPRLKALRVGPGEGRLLLATVQAPRWLRWWGHGCPRMVRRGTQAGHTPALGWTLQGASGPAPQPCGAVVTSAGPREGGASSVDPRWPGSWLPSLLSPLLVTAAGAENPTSCGVATVTPGWGLRQERWGHRGRGQGHAQTAQGLGPRPWSVSTLPGPQVVSVPGALSPRGDICHLCWCHLNPSSCLEWPPCAVTWPMSRVWQPVKGSLWEGCPWAVALWYRDILPLGLGRGRAALAAGDM